MIHFNRPVSITSNAENVYVTTRDCGRIYRFSPEGIFLEKMEMGETIRLRGICCFKDKVYVVNQSHQTIVVLDGRLSKLNHYDLRSYSPMLDSLALDEDGTLYCSDYSNHCIYRIRTDGFVEVIGNGMFKSPRGIRISGNYLYVCDRDNDCIRRIHKENQETITFLSKGRGRGEVRKPTDIEFYEDAVFVCDQDNYLIQIFNKDFEYISQIGGKGTTCGTFDMANAMCRFGNTILISNRGSDRIDRLNPETLEVTPFIEARQQDGIFRRPSGICVDGHKNLYVADRHNSCIQIFNDRSRHILTIKGDEQYKFNQPTAVEMDRENNLLIVDRENSRILQFSGSRLSEISVKSGMKSPRDIAVDGHDNLYIADTGNNRVIFRSADGEKEKVLGQGICTKSLFVSAQGDVFLSDFDRNKFYWIRNNHIEDLMEAFHIHYDFKKIRGFLLSNHTIYIVDRDDDRVLKFSDHGELIRKAGGRGRDHGRFRHPVSLKMKDDILYIVDRDNDRVELFDLDLNYLSSVGYN